MADLGLTEKYCQSCSMEDIHSPTQYTQSFHLNNAGVLNKQKSQQPIKDWQDSITQTSTRWALTEHPRILSIVKAGPHKESPSRSSICQVEACSWGVVWPAQEGDIWLPGGRGSQGAGLGGCPEDKNSSGDQSRVWVFGKVEGGKENAAENQSNLKAHHDCQCHWPFWQIPLFIR